MNLDAFNQKYYVDRQNTHSIKWDMGQMKYQRADLLPMWVADMDFKCPDSVSDGLASDLTNGAFGYAHLDERYYDAWIKWNQKVHNVTYDKEWLRFSDGAVSGIYQCIQAFTKNEDTIVIQTPTYPPFRDSVINCGRNLVQIPLIDDGQGYFTMNFEAIEETFKAGTKMMILCSPHNPIGRVWTKAELTRLLELCVKYDVLLLSDEVHQDLIMKGYNQLPILSFDQKYFEHIIALNACAKTFNLAQFSHSHILIPSVELRGIYDEFAKTLHLGGVKYLNAMASCYAYEGGYDWLQNILAIIEENYQLVVEGLKDLPIEISKLEGTYLIFVNLKHVLKGRDIEDFMINEVKVLPNFGKTFEPSYDKWVRINLATSKANTLKFINQLVEACACK